MLKDTVLFDIREQDLGQLDIILNALLQVVVNPAPEHWLDWVDTDIWLMAFVKQGDQFLTHEFFLSA